MPEAATQKHLEILSEIRRDASATAGCGSSLKTRAPTPPTLHALIAGWHPLEVDRLSPDGHSDPHPTTTAAELKATSISADAMLEEFRAFAALGVAGRARAPERQFDAEVISQAQSAADLVGYLNYIHPYRVQILGAREIAYLTRGTASEDRAFAASPASSRSSRRCWCWPTARPAPDELLAICERAQLPLFATARVVLGLRHRPAARLPVESTSPSAPSMHGVFMEILSLGVLITGESGLGKAN